MPLRVQLECRLRSAKPVRAWWKRLLQAHRVGDVVHASRRLGDGGDAGERGNRVRAVAGVAGVAPFGQHLGGVDLPGTRERGEDGPVGVGGELREGRAVQVLAHRSEGLQDRDQGQHGVAARGGLSGCDHAGRGRTQPGQQPARRRIRAA